MTYHRDVGDPLEDEATAEIGEWLGTPAAAKYLGVVTRTLYRLVNDGQVPAFKFGRVIRFRRTDLDDYIERCRIQPGDLENLAPPTKAHRSDDEDE
jgi:excisionase family DNA binding protein